VLAGVLTAPFVILCAAGVTAPSLTAAVLCAISAAAVLYGSVLVYALVSFSLYLRKAEGCPLQNAPSVFGSTGDPASALFVSSSLASQQVAGCLVVLGPADGEKLRHAVLPSPDCSTCVLRSVGVDPSFRGLRLGSALLDAGLLHAREKGFTKVVLVTSTIMVDAVRLYRRRGFAVTAEHPQLPVFGFSLLTMSLSLDPSQ
jgi:ribosomal protein S18 acetylase RimI-like enzyme